ncbi:MAG TPA: stalk domain-containing protein [Syntrophomonadaceae bacterium]|nr:stalk domain-containing protein [Syntrophomonadaceae bacterium]
MKKRWIMLLATVMLFAFTAGVVAAPAVQTITASLANDFKFTLNGEAWTPKDADGSTMAPIVYNDRTYLPARAIAEALGITVGWDAETRTVILGEPAAPVEEEPVEEEPVEEEPIEEEPIAPEAELAIEPTEYNLSKNNVQDIPINITWGNATKITGIKGVAKTSLGDLTLEPKEGTHYVVEGDVLTIKKELTGLVPVPMNMVPTGTPLTLTITFDDGVKEFLITVVE